MKIIGLFSCLSIFLLDGCSNSKSCTPFELHKALYLAQNEDSIDNYQVALLRNNDFYYTHIKNDISPVIKEYSQGTYIESGDTIFIRYNKNHRPIGVTNYLIKEAQGHFFIQYFTNGKKRIFLRIRKPHFR